MFGQPSHGLSDECISVKDDGKCWSIDPVCKRDTGQLQFRDVLQLSCNSWKCEFAWIWTEKKQQQDWKLLETFSQNFYF